MLYCWLMRNCLLQVATNRHVTTILFTIIGEIACEEKKRKLKVFAYRGFSLSPSLVLLDRMAASET